MSAGVASCNSTPATQEPPWLHVRREPFEYGLLPIPSLTHNDGVAGLKTLRGMLLQQTLCISDCSTNKFACSPINAGSQEGGKHVATAGIAASLGLPEAHAHLILDTLASILPDEGAGVDSLSCISVTDIDSVGADVNDLLLFLYLQNYRRVPSRPYRDAAAVADVWPSTSAIDGFLPAISPLQARSAALARRSMPCQAEEEIHQLAYVQKHLSSLLDLLAESTDEESDTKVVTAEKFEHLGLLLKANDGGMKTLPLSQAAPFFSNADPVMPAAPVPFEQVLDWLSQHICAASENLRERPLTKENGLADTVASEATDVTMEDVSGSTPSSTQTIILPNGLLQLQKDWHPEGLTFVDGVTRSSVLKGEQDITGVSVKVSHCHDSVVYVLAPLKYVSVFGCSDSIVVLGAVGKAVRVEHCERVQLIVPCARICIANCRDCLFYLGVNQRPLVVGDNYNLQVAPYNTFYPRLEAHLAKVGVDITVNRWDRILTLGGADPHDSFSHPAGDADGQAEGVGLLQPEKFTMFTVPRWSEVKSEQQVLTRANPFLLPKPYLLAQQHRGKSAECLRQMLKAVALEDSKKRELTTAIHAHFREWLFASGNIRQLYELQGLDGDSKTME